MVTWHGWMSLLIAPLVAVAVYERGVYSSDQVDVIWPARQRTAPVVAIGPARGKGRMRCLLCYVSRLSRTLERAYLRNTERATEPVRSMIQSAKIDRSHSSSPQAGSTGQIAPAVELRVAALTFAQGGLLTFVSVEGQNRHLPNTVPIEGESLDATAARLLRTNLGFSGNTRSSSTP